MAIILHLGVMDIAYSDGSGMREVQFHTKSGKPVKFTAKESTATTGDVAGFLENKYHVMEHFYEAHSQEIADALTQSVADALADTLGGAPVGDTFQGATEEFRTWFMTFIDTRELDSLGYPGIPTAASLRGVNHRMKDPYAKRGSRPSFRDTGTYEDSFKAWVD